MTEIRLPRRLVYFVALSLLAHFWIIYGAPFARPRSGSAPLVLEARLQPAPPLPPVLPRAQSKPTAKPALEPVLSAPLPNAVPAPEAAPQAQSEPAAIETIEEPVAPPSAIVDSNPVASPVTLLARRLDPKAPDPVIRPGHEHWDAEKLERATARFAQLEEQLKAISPGR